MSHIQQAFVTMRKNDSFPTNLCYGITFLSKRVLLLRSIKCNYSISADNPMRFWLLPFWRCARVHFFKIFCMYVRSLPALAVWIIVWTFLIVITTICLSVTRLHYAVCYGKLKLFNDDQFDMVYLPFFDWLLCNVMTYEVMSVIKWKQLV